MSGALFARRPGAPSGRPAWGARALRSTSRGPGARAPGRGTRAGGLCPGETGVTCPVEGTAAKVLIWLLRGTYRVVSDSAHSPRKALPDGAGPCPSQGHWNWSYRLPAHSWVGKSFATSSSRTCTRSASLISASHTSAGKVREAVWGLRGYTWKWPAHRPCFRSHSPRARRP